MEKLGMYSLLDMHQDVLWPVGSDGYWGVPPWIKDKMNVTSHPYPWPMESITSWSCGYLTEHISTAFQNFYDNQNGVLDDNAEFWGNMAQRFKDQSSVLGYEIMNEPWAGNVFKDKLKLLPGKAGEMNLASYYDTVQRQIRKYDQVGLIFWEPVSFICTERRL